MSAQNTTPVSPSQFQPWASFFGGNVTAPYANPTAFGANALGAPPSNGQYTGGWAYPDAWANFYEGTQGFTAPQNQNSPAGALAVTNYAQNVNNPNDPNLLGWEHTFGNPNTILQHDQNWAQSLGSAPTGTPSNELTGGWQNPEAWSAFYGGTSGFTAPDNAGSPASALAAASQIAQTSNPESNPALLGWIQDYGQPGNVLANTPNWAASLGTPQVNAMGQGVDQTNTQGWTSPLAWAAYYGGFQGYKQPVDNTLQAAQNWAGVTNQNDPSLLGWQLDYGNPQTVVSTILASPEYQAYLAALAEQQRLANLPPPAPPPAPAPAPAPTRRGRHGGRKQQAAAAQAAADAAYYTAKPVQVNGAGAPGGFLAASGYGSSIQGATSYAASIPAATSYGSNIAGSPNFTAAQVHQGAAVPGTSGTAAAQQTQLVPGTDITSFVTRGADGSKIDIRSDGSIYVNGQLSVAPVRALQSARLYNTPGSGVNVPSFGTNNIQGAGGASGAFGLEQLPRPSGAAVGGDPFNALYNYTNTTFAQAFTAGETQGGMVPPGAPIEPLFGGKGGEGGFGGGLGPATIQLKDGTVLLVQGTTTPIVLTPSYAQRVADAYPFDPFADPAVSQAQLGSPAYAGAIQSYLNYLTQVLHGAESGQAPQLGAPNAFNEGFIELPQQLQQEPDFNRNVDDFGRPIPDVGPPQPFSLPDFGGLASSVEQTLGNLGVGWTPPAQPETLAPSFQLPDFGGLENTIQQTLSGLLPGWTPPAQQEEQPGTFWGNVLSGLGNLGTGFNPNTPDTSGINPEVSIDQVAPFLDIADIPDPNIQFAPQPPELPNPDIQFAPSGFPNPDIQFAPPRQDVFTDPGVGLNNAGFGASTLYQGGYGEPVWEAKPREPLPPGPPLTAAETFIQKMGGRATLYQLAQSKGGDGAQQMIDNKDMLGEGAFKTPLDLSQPLEPQIIAVIGGSGLVANKVVAALKAEAPSAAVQQHLMDVAADAQQDIQGGDRAYGPAPTTGSYNTVPVYGDVNSGVPSYGAPGSENFPRPPADVGPQGPPRPPVGLPDSFAQGSPFAGAPPGEEGSYTPGTMGFLHGMQNLYGKYGGSTAQVEADARAVAEQLGLNFKVLGGSAENVPAQTAAVKEYLANNYDLSALLGFSGGAGTVNAIRDSYPGLNYMTVAGPGPQEGFYAPGASHMQQLGMYGDYLSDQSGEGFGPAQLQTATPNTDFSYLEQHGGHSTTLIGEEGNIGAETGSFDQAFANRLEAAGRAYKAATGNDPVYGEADRGPDIQDIYYQAYQLRQRGLPIPEEWAALGASGGIAAPPGASSHNRNPGMAMDLPSSGFRDWLKTGGNAANFGINFPVPGDAPHAQPIPNWGGQLPQQAQQLQQHIAGPEDFDPEAIIGPVATNANWSAFQPPPSGNVEDVRPGYIPAAEPDSADFLWESGSIGPTGEKLPLFPDITTTPVQDWSQGYGGGTLPPSLMAPGAPDLLTQLQPPQPLQQGYDEFGQPTQLYSNGQPIDAAPPSSWPVPRIEGGLPGLESFPEGPAPWMTPPPPAGEPYAVPGGADTGMVGSVLPRLMQLIYGGYNYLNPQAPTIDQVAGPGLAAEPTFANLQPQPLEPGSFPDYGGLNPQPFTAPDYGAYNPPADVFAAEDPRAMQFQGGPLAGTPSPFPSSANISALTHGMYPIGTVPHTPEYQVFTGQPDPNVIYAPQNTTNFGDVGSYVDPTNRGQFNLTINPTGRSGYNTNLGGVSLPWSGTYNNMVLVQAPNGEWQYLPIVDKGPNQTALSQGELDILNASLPGFGYTDRAHMPGAGWQFQVMNPQSGMTGPPIVNPQGGPYAGQQWFTDQPAAPVLRFTP